MTTPAMRERLIGQMLTFAPDDTDHRAPEWATRAVDAILAELREPDDAMYKAVFDEWGECESAHFTAMIDAVREGK